MFMLSSPIGWPIKDIKLTAHFLLLLLVHASSATTQLSTCWFDFFRGPAEDGNFDHLSFKEFLTE